MRKVILLLSIVVSLVFINTAIVNACSCAQPAAPKESLKQSTEVFAGKVVDFNVPSGTLFNNAGPVYVTFEVSEVWKGPDYKTLIVTTSRDSASCGYSFKQDKEYLVYAYGESDKLNTNVCSRTKLLASAQEDLQELGKGTIPTKTNVVFGLSNLFWIILILCLILIILIVVYFLRGV